MPDHRRAYSEDDTLCDRVFELLDTWLPELRELRDRSARMNSRWEEISTPFVRVENGEVIAHVGLLEMSLCILGEPHVVGGVHAVCTRSDRRRRGLFRSLIEALIEHCEGRYETLVLTTDEPKIYEPFGFRVVREQRFAVPVSSPGGGPGLRPLRIDSDTDLELLDRLLERRTSVSDVLGVLSEKDVFKFNLEEGHLLRSDALDLVMLMERNGRRLIVYDLVAPVVPSLARLLGELADPVDEAQFCFSPDRLGVVRPHAVPLTEDDGVLMVRGAFGTDGRPFMLPPSARC